MSKSDLLSKDLEATYNISISKMKLVLDPVCTELINRYKLKSSLIDGYDPLTNYKNTLFLSCKDIVITARIDPVTNKHHNQIYVEFRGESKRVTSWNDASTFLMSRLPVSVN